MIDKETSSWKISLFIIVALCLLLGLILFIFFINIGWESNNYKQGSENLEQPTVVRTDPLIKSVNPILPPIENIDPKKGAINPTLTIVFLSDFNCAYCKRMSEVWQQVLDDHGDKIQIVWKDLLNNPGSLQLHKAARCAQLQGKFWEYHDVLLTHVQEGVLSDQLAGYATSLDMDREDFMECLTDLKTEAVVFASTEQAINLGVDSTPSYFIGDDFYEGFREYDEIKTIIEEKLGIKTEE